MDISERFDLAEVKPRCESRSLDGNQCDQDAGHTGTHTAFSSQWADLRAEPGQVNASCVSCKGTFRAEALLRGGYCVDCAPVPSPGIPTRQCERCGVRKTSDLMATPSICLDCFRPVVAAPGRKDDAAKPPLEELAEVSGALAQVAQVLAYGSAKYSRGNWRKVEPKTRYVSAALRHLFAAARGEKTDAESGLPHLAHAACCVLFLLEIETAEKKDTP